MVLQESVEEKVKITMRKRKEILNDGKRTDLLTLEVLLDIRDILVKQIKKRGVK